MTAMSDELVNVRVYNRKVQKCICVWKRQSVWFSKNLPYETPYSVTGIIKLTGSEQAPKAIMYR